MFIRIRKASGSGSRLAVRALEYSGAEVVNEDLFPPLGRKRKTFEPDRDLNFSERERMAVEGRYRELLVQMPYWYDTFRGMKGILGSAPMLIDALTEAFVIVAQELARNPITDPKPIIRGYLQRIAAHRYTEISIEVFPPWKKW